MSSIRSIRPCVNLIFNPLYPPIMGDFLLVIGDTPKTPPEGSPSGLPCSEGRL